MLDERSRVGGLTGWEYHLHSTEVGLSNGLIKPMFSGRVADYVVLGGLGAGLTRLPDLWWGRTWGKDQPGSAARHARGVP